MNIILIGMPGAGKSTVGPALAQATEKIFMDTDEFMREKEGMELKDIVNSLGYEVFLKKQENAILSLKTDNYIIATGGSTVCSDIAMQHLKNNGKVIYLKLLYNEIEKRLAPDRRLARGNGKTLTDVYDERVPLYEKYSDIIIDCSNKSIETIVNEILLSL